MPPAKSRDNGLHMLIKWSTKENLWDNYSIRKLVDLNLAKRIASENDYSQFINKEVDIKWKDGEESSRAKIISLGTSEEMEKKLKKEVLKANKRPAKSSAAQKIQNQDILLNVEEAQNKREDKLLEKIEKLKNKNLRLQEEVEKLKQMHDMDRMVKRFKKTQQRLENVISGIDLNSSTSSHTPEFETVDLGSGVNIKKGELVNLEFSCGGNPKIFARGLLQGLFSLDELLNGSISGKQSNAYRDRSAKKQLDPVKMNTIINYTMNKYPINKGALKQSIQSKIKEIRIKNDKESTNKKKKSNNKTSESASSVSSDKSNENIMELLEIEDKSHDQFDELDKEDTVLENKKDDQVLENNENENNQVDEVTS